MLDAVKLTMPVIGCCYANSITYSSEIITNYPIHWGNVQMGKNQGKFDMLLCIYKYVIFMYIYVCVLSLKKTRWRHGLSIRLLNMSNLSGQVTISLRPPDYCTGVVQYCAKPSVCAGLLMSGIQPSNGTLLISLLWLPICLWVIAMIGDLGNSEDTAWLASVDLAYYFSNDLAPISVWTVYSVWTTMLFSFKLLLKL